jgi:hypothetical protein
MGSEFVVPTPAGPNRQIAAARWEFTQAIERVVPEFFQRLRDTVYPSYARLAHGRADYWRPGWRFSTWCSHSDAAQQLTPTLLDWARAFHLEREEWILEGALQTLSNWHQWPKSRDALVLGGFRQYLAEPGRISDAEHHFYFEDWGWDPSMISSATWLAQVKECFEKALDAHLHKMRELAQDRGMVAAVPLFSPEHFEWLALYQCGNLPLEDILARARAVSSKSTISKGMHHAAELAGLEVRPKRSQLKSL